VRSIALRLLFGLWLTSWSANTLAAEARPPLLVLDFDTKGASPLEAEAATRNAARGLRALDVFQVLTSEDVRQLLAIERTRQLVGAANSPALSGISSALGAEHAVVGTVSKVGNDLQVELRLLNTKTNTVLSTKSTAPTPGMEPLAAALPDLAQELMAPLLREQQGNLLVRSREEAAEVMVDDTLVASTPMKTPVALPRGAHRLQVRKDGFIAQSQTVRIEPNQVTSPDVNLLPSADYAEAWKIRHGRLRIGAYLATGAAVALLGGGILLDRAATDPLYRTQFHPRQLVLQAAQGQASQSEPAAVSQDPEAHQTWLACTADLTACNARAHDLSTQLFIQQFATGGLVVVGLAAGTVATWLWLTGQDPNRYANVIAGVTVTNGGFGLAFEGRF
jgi:TolB-like protein